MNNIIIIGNGFDLAHGLKTRYSDFILWYVKKINNKISRGEPYEDGLIKIENPCRVQFPILINSIEDFIEFMEWNPNITYGEVKPEIRHPFFSKLLDIANTKNWVDIEFEYYQNILKILNEKSEFQLTNSELEEKILGLNTCLEAIKIELSNYLSFESNSDFEILEDMKSHLNGISTLSSKSKGEGLLLLNFNYTSTIEKYADVLEQCDYKVNYIHGKFGDENNPIIFGYGDEMDKNYADIENLNINGFLDNIKSFLYANNSNYRQLLNFINNAPFTVHIMGHSCGISDRLLFNGVLEHENCNSINIYYHEISKAQNDFFQKTQELSRHFKPEKKGRMRTMIVPFNESKPLVRLR